jgi:hypothetical protein
MLSPVEASIENVNIFYIYRDAGAWMKPEDFLVFNELHPAEIVVRRSRRFGG